MIQKNHCMRCEDILAGNRLYCSNCGFLNTTVSENVVPQIPFENSLASMSTSVDIAFHPYPDTTWSVSHSMFTSPSSINDGSSSMPPRTALSNRFICPSFHEDEQAFSHVDGIPGDLRRDGELVFLVRMQKAGMKKHMFLGMLALILFVVVSGLVEYYFLQSSVSSKNSGVSTLPVPKFADHFVDNKNQWNLQSEVGRYAVKVEGGDLLLEDDNNSLLPVLLPGNKTYDNFKLMVDATLKRGDTQNGYGIYIRGSSDQNGNLAAYYRIELYGDRSYAVFKGIIDVNGRPREDAVRIVDYTANEAIRGKGEINHLVVVANGGSITFIVNGQTLKTFIDTTYTKGLIALFVSNIQHAHRGAQARFSNLAIYPVKS